MGSSLFEEEDEEDFRELTSDVFSPILSGSSSEELKFELELELDFDKGNFLSFASSRDSKASTSLDTSICIVSFSTSLFEDDDDEEDFLELLLDDFSWIKIGFFSTSSSEELELDCKRGLFFSF